MSSVYAQGFFDEPTSHIISMINCSSKRLFLYLGWRVGDQGFAENSVQILVGGKAVCVFCHLVGSSGKSCMTLELSLMSDCFMM